MFRLKSNSINQSILTYKENKMKKFNFIVSIFAIGFLFSFASISAEANADKMLLGINVGLVGYDPVSYFPEGGSKPQKGFVLRNYTYKEVVYRFSNDTNLAKFKASPDKFLPQYGGWCAWAIAKLNQKVDVDPESYVIRDGKLYLFYNHKELNTRADWLANVEDFLPKGNSNWAKLIKK